MAGNYCDLVDLPSSKRSAYWIVLPSSFIVLVLVLSLPQKIIMRRNVSLMGMWDVVFSQVAVHQRVERL